MRSLRALTGWCSRRAAAVAMAVPLVIGGAAIAQSEVKTGGTGGGTPASASASNTGTAAEATPPATPAAPSGTAPTPPTTPAPAPTPAPATPEKAEKLVYVDMQTSMGQIVIELNREKAPISSDNFLAYVDKKFYDGTIFHRVIPTFMIQGGGFSADMKEKQTDKPIKNEWQNGLKNVRGSLAMARTSAPDSATAQFFINVVDNAFLDQPRGGAAYAVFGRVVKGMETVDKIKGVAMTSKRPHDDVPVEAVVITTATRMSAEQVEALKTELAKAPKK